MVEILSLAANLINTVIQSFLAVWATNIITTQKLSKSKLLATSMIIAISCLTFTFTLSNLAFQSFIIMITSYGILQVAFGRKYIDALVGYGFMTTIFSIQAIVFISVYKMIVSKFNLAFNEDVQILIFIYIPVFITYTLLYLARKPIFNYIIYLKSLKGILVPVIVIDYIILIYSTLHLEILYGDINSSIRAIIYASIAVVLVIYAIYIAKISNLNREIQSLNDSMNNKIIELRKLKHDYGSEISALNMLYSMGQMDKVGNMLKDIITKHQTVGITNIYEIKANPIVASILTKVAQREINLIISDNCSYDKVDISENDLVKILSNIISNAVEAVSNVENPIVKYNSYDTYKGSIITISNNGPKIPSELRKKIFTSGFTTKLTDSENHGYGLAIVQDLVEKCEGFIYVKSDDNETIFRLELPFKKSNN